ncbi:MAG: tRNA pseudouridine(55) synthase TruB [Erysipelotrichaceae bacterium]|nr:tRNA pseudouridine(55) synthase TruB [Erysipelotrichaceae bacterium]MDO5085749.1 tRNA pseudouridine(55) synthase TruB [Erysipelotrichaceae bacterium]
MNGILYINKPAGYTSMDVISILRRYLKIKAIGQTGTLDYNATGVLIVLVGKATKLSQFLVKQRKEYIATLRLGIKTDTGDIWGNVIEEKKEVPSFHDEVLQEVLDSFLGVSMQVPPMMSAIKVKGQKLYELYHKGIEVQRKERPIEIYDIKLLRNQETIEFKVCVSSGTYIRTLCEDIACRLGTIGTMQSLLRSQVGHVSLQQCVSLSDVECGNYQLHNGYDVLSMMYTMIEYNNIQDVYHGKKIKLDCMDDVVMITFEKEVIAAYQRKEDGYYHCLRGLW